MKRKQARRLAAERFNARTRFDSLDKCRQVALQCPIIHVTAVGVDVYTVRRMPRLPRVKVTHPDYTHNDYRRVYARQTFGTLPAPLAAHSSQALRGERIG